MNVAIQTENLGRIYKIRGGKKSEPKELMALEDVNLQVRPGELFGLLGPNGAGKTTLIKILTTLLAPSSGQAWVAGFDVAQDPQKVRERINMVSGGETSGYGLLTVRENLWMFAQFYGIPSKEANQRIKELLEIVGLADRINAKSSDLSTGLRQKMNIVRGFMTDPSVLFLDEPTLGLDVGASRDVRNFIRSWIDEDQTRTLLLTTHYMVEADELCDRVAILRDGEIRATERVSDLVHVSFHWVTLRFREPVSAELLVGVSDVSDVSEQENALRFRLTGDFDPVLRALNSYYVVDVQTEDPTLEEIFLTYYGNGKNSQQVMHMKEADRAKEVAQ